MTTRERRRVNRTDVQSRNPPRFRVSGVTAAVTTLQEAELLDLSLEGALVEHQGMLALGSPCFLQVGIAEERLTIHSRVVHSRGSRKEPEGGVFYQTGLAVGELARGARG